MRTRSDALTCLLLPHADALDLAISRLCKQGEARRFEAILLPMALKGLKAWDIDAARQPDQYVANSRVVAQRIRDCYGREAIVIPPPIDAAGSCYKLGRMIITSCSRAWFLTRGSISR